VLIERGEMGGSRLHTACVPSKALIAAARAAHGGPIALRPPGEAPLSPPDHRQVMAHVKQVIADLAPADSAARYAALGVTVLKGAGAFADRDTVVAAGKEVKARRFVIASGSRPSLPALAGLDAVPYLTNETVFGLAERPGHLLVIGASPEGCELAQAFRRLGSEVTLFDAGGLLPQEDPELAGILRQALAADGVALHEETRPAAIAAAADGVRLHYTDAASGPRQASGTHLLLAAGRTPTTLELGLEAGWIKHDKGGIMVDHGMRTSNRRVFAIGDCVGGAAGVYRSTHAASHQASLVIRNALFRQSARFAPTLVPRVVFTAPEIAAVGLSEQEARARHGRIRILRFPLGESDRARAEAEPEGLVKLVASPNGRVLGAAICGRGAGELIGLWVLALQQQLKVAQIASLAMPYPTLGEASRRAALEFYAPLTRRPLVRRLLGFMRALG